jgi:hypothetical protein
MKGSCWDVILRRDSGEYGWGYRKCIMRGAGFWVDRLVGGKRRFTVVFGGSRAQRAGLGCESRQVLDVRVYNETLLAFQ